MIVTPFDGVLSRHEIVAEKHTFEASISFTVIDIGMIVFTAADSDSSFISFLPIYSDVPYDKSR